MKNKKSNSSREYHLWLIAAGIFLILSLHQKNLTYAVFAFAFFLYATESQKKDDKDREDDDHGQKS